MTKLQKRLYEIYKSATATTLREVYGCYSEKKEDAMQYCRELQYNMNGYDGRICTANSFQFSYAFRYINESGKECLAYITKANNRYFEI